MSKISIEGNTSGATTLTSNNVILGTTRWSQPIQRGVQVWTLTIFHGLLRHDKKQYPKPE